MVLQVLLIPKGWTAQNHRRHPILTCPIKAGTRPPIALIRCPPDVASG